MEHTRINKKINIAKMLADTAIQKGSTDNVTVIVVFF
jgi:serine/threonine protein phosphatase PrpC